MEANRVMSDEQIRAVNPDECVCGITDARDLCKAQDKISFKVGEKLGYTRGYASARSHCEDVLLPQEKLAGIEEVVEWLNENCMVSVLDKNFTYKDKGSITFSLGNLKDSNEWQAKLKEWNER